MTRRYGKSLERRAAFRREASLGSPLILKDGNVAKVAGKTLVTAIGAGLAGRHVHDFFEIARLAGEAFHKVGETASDVLTPPDEEENR